MSTLKSRSHLNLTELETREVPAAFAFYKGVLTVKLAQIATHQVSLGTNSVGTLIINGRQSGGTGNFVSGIATGKLATSRVAEIRIVGSDFNDVVDLTGVTTQGFRNLNGRVAIDGRGGNDTIRGSSTRARVWRQFTASPAAKSNVSNGPIRNQSRFP